MHNWIHNRRGRWRAFLSLTAAAAIMASPATALATPSPSPSSTPTASVPAATPATQPGTPSSTTAAGTADRAGSDKIAAVPVDAPPSFSQLTEPPEREDTPHHEGEEVLRAQQDALTVPVDELPAAPAAQAARIQSEPLPEGFTEEDARLSLRMQTALAADCQVYFPSPFAVCGEIRNKYNAMGGPSSFLGLPKTEELQNPGATGFRSEFLHGSIYWSPTTGAHPVTPLFMTKWSEHGWEAGWMGYPTSDEIGHPGAEGSHQEFEGAAIYWHATTLTLAAIGGAIRDKWDALGAQDSMLGYPTSDENDTPDGIGKYNTFEYGSIYWSPATGAHPVTGDILAVWGALGYEASWYGYPIEDPVANSTGGMFQKFQNGEIESPISLVKDAFSCVSLALQSAQESGLQGDLQYLCLPYGVSVKGANGVTAFASPTEGDDSTRSQNITQDSGSVECDWMEPTSISEPRKNFARVSKDVHLCFGVANFEEQKVLWSKNLEFNVANVLDQRMHQRVETKITSLDTPSRTFTLTYRLREDISGWPDETVTEQSTVNTGTSLEPAVSSYSTPGEDGVYFVEIVGMSLEVPSLGYDQSFDGMRFAIGRYTCPSYSGSGYGDPCEWTDPVDDHT